MGHIFKYADKEMSTTQRGQIEEEGRGWVNTPSCPSRDGSSREKTKEEAGLSHRKYFILIVLST